MAASARAGERATSFTTACSLLSRFVRQNGAAAAELGLGIKGERFKAFAWFGEVAVFWRFDSCEEVPVPVRFLV